MGNRLTRRAIITSGLAASATAAASILLGKRYGLVPPDHGGLFGIGETLTYAAHRILLSRQPLAREFSRSQISTNFPAINTTLPGSLSLSIGIEMSTRRNSGTTCSTKRAGCGPNIAWLGTSPP